METGITIAQDFWEYNTTVGKYHLGEDWNGEGGDDTDEGDPVYSISNGTVSYAGFYSASWGNVIIINHNLPSNEYGGVVTSLYAHLQEIMVSDGQPVARGQQIGKIGRTGTSANNIPHLHFELRSDETIGVDHGYSVPPKPEGWLDPSDFIVSHRPQQAYYAFDEGSGTVTGDSSGNGHNGTINGATWATGKNAGGLSFDGINDYVSVPRMNNDEVSICAWFYKNANDTTRNDAIVSGFSSNSNLQLREGFELRFPAGAPDTLEFILVTQDGSGIKASRTIRRNLLMSVGSWYHVVGTYSRTTGQQRLYVNGELVRTQTHPAANTIVPLTFYPDMRIGYSRVNNGYFNGVIDDVRLYNRPLSDQEIRALCHAFTGDLQVHYTLDEGSGTIAGDSSGNGKHGGINGGATWVTGRSGTGLHFDGLDDYVTIPRINNDEVSITAWFYKNANDTTRNDAIFGGFRNNSNTQLREGFELRFPSGASNNTLQFVLVTQGGSGVRTMRTAQWNLGNSVGSWYHVTGTYNKTTGEQRLYVNGQLMNTQAHPAGSTVVPLISYIDMRMGYSRVNAGYFNGVLDDVRLYKRALSDQEVLDLYHSY